MEEGTQLFRSLGQTVGMGHRDGFQNEKHGVLQKRERTQCRLGKCRMLSYTCVGIVANGAVIYSSLSVKHLPSM